MHPSNVYRRGSLLSGTVFGTTLAVSLAFAGPATAHPLDGLSSDEISDVVEILREEGRTTGNARFPLIDLKEPEKEAVLDWEAGDTLVRKATVNVVTENGTFKGVVDITNRDVLFWEEASGETMLLLEEFLGAMELALSNEQFVDALSKRGLTPDQVFCLPLTAGSFGDPAEEGKRLMKVPCYRNPAGSNFYAKPIEGLFATVDLNAGEVVDVTDTGVVPVPEDDWGYTEEEIAQRADMTLRDEMNPAQLSQPGEPNYSIDGSLIQWDIWQFRWRVDKRPGVVLSEIEADIGNGPRTVLYQAHLSEVFVPYMDPDEGWYWRTYMDSGEYGFGIFMSPLTAGVDCPEYATFLPAQVHTDTGQPTKIPDAICIFERNIGDPAWRHYEIFAQSPDNPVPAEGRAATELVVRSASEVGNYDYLIDYVFQQDGMIRVMVGSTGLDAVQGAAATSMESDTAETETEYGTLIAPNLVAPNHDHYFNFRLDFDIDGRDNSFLRTRLEPAEAPEDVPRQSMWVAKQEVPDSEMDARYRVSPRTPAMYHVVNPTAKSKLGHHPSYVIDPNNAISYSMLNFESDPPAIRNAYIEYQIWTTQYDPDQRYAGGEYAYQSSGEDTLAKWVEADRNIRETDIVTWYTMGFHHVPRMEDWPVMPTNWKSIRLKPFNFFGHNPAITIPDTSAE
jgi:primary-amine oxidase